MKGIAVEFFFIDFILVAKKKSEFHSHISYENEQDACDSNAHMFCLFKKPVIGNIIIWYFNSMARHRWLCQAI